MLWVHFQVPTILGKEYPWINDELVVKEHVRYRYVGWVWGTLAAMAVT